MRFSLLELVIVLTAVILPNFLLADRIRDGDEFAQAGTGLAIAGVVLAAYKVWKGRSGGGEG